MKAQKKKKNKKQSSQQVVKQVKSAIAVGGLGLTSTLLMSNAASAQLTPNNNFLNWLQTTPLTQGDFQSVACAIYFPVFQSQSDGLNINGASGTTVFNLCRWLTNQSGFWNSSMGAYDATLIGYQGAVQMGPRRFYNLYGVGNTLNTTNTTNTIINTLGIDYRQFGTVPTLSDLGQIDFVSPPQSTVFTNPSWFTAAQTSRNTVSLVRSNGTADRTGQNPYLSSILIRTGPIDGIQLFIPYTVSGTATRGADGTVTIPGDCSGNNDYYLRNLDPAVLPNADRSEFGV
jgi:hypothetical protein